MTEFLAATATQNDDLTLDVGENRRRIDRLAAEVTRLTADLANLNAIIDELLPMTDYQSALAGALVRRGYLPSAAMRAALKAPLPNRRRETHLQQLETPPLPPQEPARAFRVVRQEQ
jgi:hypothetical protein